jgi:UDP-2,3-diacylglucosamine hydrolase
VSFRRPGGDLVFIGDVHIDRDDPSLPDFLHLLEGLGRRASCVVFLGDLFNIWIGGRGMEQPHQAAVLDVLTGLRREGVVVRYLEGNRDYRIGHSYAGTAIDDASDEGLVERHGGHSFFVTHGDLVNLADRQYRMWRRFSRSAPVWALVRLLPERRRVAMAESLEKRMRKTNLAYKQEFPEAQVRAYAATRFREGHDIVVLGHFHVEKELTAEMDGVERRILVLPEWRESRRHLVARIDGTVEFVDSDA